MITRAQIRRQLRASGGIMDAVPRKKLGIGSTFQDFKDKVLGRTRKLIPNELATAASVAAPFVAPFNPALAAAMAGIGGFDRSGNIGQSLKSAALTYGLGQGARALGGADLQGNPFKQGGAFRGGFEGFKGGFSSPVSSGNMEKVFGTPKGKIAGPVEGILGTGKEATEGILGKLNITEGGGSLKLTGLGKVSAGALASYFVAKGATPEEAKDLTQDVYRGEGIGFDQIREDINKYKSGELNQQQMFDKNYRFLVPRGLFRAAEGGRAEYQTGGISSANTLAQNVAANRQQAANIQAMLNAARTKEGLPTVQAPAQTQAAPAPSITIPAPTQTQVPTMQQTIAPSMQQITSAMLSDQPSGSVLPSLPSRTTVVQPTTSSQSTGLSGLLSPVTKQVTSQITAQPTQQTAQQYAMPDRTGMLAGPPIAPMVAPFEKYGITPDQYANMSPDDQAAVMRRVDRDMGIYTELGQPLYGVPDDEVDDYGITFAKGGRVGFEGGGTGFMKWLKANYGLEVKDLDMDQYSKLSREYNNENPDPEETGRKKNAGGGIMSMPTGDIRKNKAGIMERDYRDKGGFVPVGIKEKADDVPAMLSKNEFVMTANAVRGAGNGNIEKGAQRMYNAMKKLEGMVK